MTFVTTRNVCTTTTMNTRILNTDPHDETLESTLDDLLNQDWEIISTTSYQEDGAPKILFVLRKVKEVALLPHVDYEKKDDNDKRSISFRRSR